MNGFIALHRKFIEWEWYDDANTMRLFVHCLLKANWKDRKWRGEMIQRGSFITSLGKLSEELRLSRKQIMHSLDKLVSTGEITKKGTAWTQISICNYDSYQDEAQKKGTEMEQKGTTKGTEREQKGIQLNKDNKENKEIKKQEREGRFAPPSQDEVIDLFEEKTGNRAWSVNMGEMFWAHYENNGWKIGRSKMKNWKLAVSQWISRAKQEGKLPKAQEYKFDNEGNLLL